MPYFHQFWKIERKKSGPNNLTFFFVLYTKKLDTHLILLQLSNFKFFKRFSVKSITRSFDNQPPSEKITPDNSASKCAIDNYSRSRDGSFIRNEQ